LSPRETEILRLVAGGESNQAIADRLVLSRRTVENHIANVYSKIGAANRVEATRFALEHDLLPGALA
jgi:DNA-binding NarL/FixJ family response regulator